MKITWLQGDEDAVNSIVAELARRADREGEETVSLGDLDVIKNVGFTAFEGASSQPNCGIGTEVVPYFLGGADTVCVFVFLCPCLSL